MIQVKIELKLNRNSIDNDEIVSCVPFFVLFWKGQSQDKEDKL